MVAMSDMFWSTSPALVAAVAAAIVSVYGALWAKKSADLTAHGNKVVSDNNDEVHAIRAGTAQHSFACAEQFEKIQKQIDTLMSTVNGLNERLNMIAKEYLPILDQEAFKKLP